MRNPRAVELISQSPRATEAIEGFDVKFLQRALAQMIVQGMDVDCERLYRGRDLEPARLATLNKQAAAEPSASCRG